MLDVTIQEYRAVTIQEYRAMTIQERLPHGARMHTNAHIIKKIGVAVTIQEYRAVTIQECLP